MGCRCCSAPVLLPSSTLIPRALRVKGAGPGRVGGRGGARGGGGGGRGGLGPGVVA